MGIKNRGEELGDLVNEQGMIPLVWDPKNIVYYDLFSGESHEPECFEIVYSSRFHIHDYDDYHFRVVGESCEPSINLIRDEQRRIVKEYSFIRNLTPFVERDGTNNHIRALCRRDKKKFQSEGETDVSKRSFEDFLESLNRSLPTAPNPPYYFSLADFSITGAPLGEMRAKKKGHYIDVFFYRKRGIKIDDSNSYYYQTKPLLRRYFYPIEPLKFQNPEENGSRIVSSIDGVFFGEGIYPLGIPVYVPTDRGGRFIESWNNEFLHSSKNGGIVLSKNRGIRELIALGGEMDQRCQELGIDGFTNGFFSNFVMQYEELDDDKILHPRISNSSVQFCKITPKSPNQYDLSLITRDCFENLNSRQRVLKVLEVYDSV